MWVDRSRQVDDVAAIGRAGSGAAVILLRPNVAGRRAVDYLRRALNAVELQPSRDPAGQRAAREDVVAIFTAAGVAGDDVTAIGGALDAFYRQTGFGLALPGDFTAPAPRGRRGGGYRYAQRVRCVGQTLLAGVAALAFAAPPM